MMCRFAHFSPILTFSGCKPPRKLRMHPAREARAEWKLSLYSVSSLAILPVVRLTAESPGQSSHPIHCQIAEYLAPHFPPNLGNLLSLPIQ